MLSDEPISGAPISGGGDEQELPAPEYGRIIINNGPERLIVDLEG